MIHIPTIEALQLHTVLGGLAEGVVERRNCWEPVAWTEREEKLAAVAPPPRFKEHMKRWVAGHLPAGLAIPRAL
jgi:hypothetical protein